MRLTFFGSSQANRDLPVDPEYARVVVYRSEAERDELLGEALDRSDWLLECSGVGVWDGELEEGIRWGSSGATPRSPAARC